MVDSGGESQVTDNVAQHFTPATGQRAYTISDVLSGVVDMVNGITDDTTQTADTPEVTVNFADAAEDSSTLSDTIVSVAMKPSVWDTTYTYVEGTCQ